MKKITLLLVFGFICQLAFAQHDHHTDDTKTTESHGHNHLAHIQTSRAQNFYIHNLPAPKLMTGIVASNLKIETKSDACQKHFNQGLNLQKNLLKNTMICSKDSQNQRWFILNY